MYWTIAASFIDKSEQNKQVWLAPFVPGKRHQFDFAPRLEPLKNWHDSKIAVTGVQDWLIYWQQSMEAMRMTKGGIITVFPQLAAMVGMQQRILRKKIPVVAWLFSVARCYGGLRHLIAQGSLKNINRFVVHTNRERNLYYKWLQLPLERFEFVPYQVPHIPVTYEEEVEKPFIAALGSNHRDFTTLFAAVKKLNVPTVVASGKRALEGFTIPQNVETPFGISKAECLRLSQQARLNIIPLRPGPLVTAAGLVSIVEAMRMGRVVIATRNFGAEDYIQHGKTGWLIEPESTDDLTQAIECLWNDAALRNRLGEAAKKHAEEHFSDEAAGMSLGRILDAVADE